MLERKKKRVTIGKTDRSDAPIKFPSLTIVSSWAHGADSARPTVDPKQSSGTIIPDGGFAYQGWRSVELFKVHCLVDFKNADRSARAVDAGEGLVALRYEIGAIDRRR